MCLLAYKAFLFRTDETLCLNVPSLVKSDGDASDDVSDDGNNAGSILKSNGNIVTLPLHTNHLKVTDHHHLQVTERLIHSLVYPFQYQ